MTDPTSLPNFAPPPDEHPLRGRVLDVLLDAGLEPDIDDDGDVAFKVNGQTMFVRCMEGDFTIMRVFGQWQIGEDIPQDELAQLRACNDLTLRLHVVGPGSDISVLLQVTIQLVLSAVQMWHESLTGGGEPGGEA